MDNSNLFQCWHLWKNEISIVISLDWQSYSALWVNMRRNDLIQYRPLPVVKLTQIDVMKFGGYYKLLISHTCCSLPKQPLTCLHWCLIRQNLNLTYSLIMNWRRESVWSAEKNSRLSIAVCASVQSVKQVTDGGRRINWWTNSLFTNSGVRAS